MPSLYWHEGETDCYSHSVEDVLGSHVSEILSAWVRAHAQDFILQYYTMLAERRRAAHRTHVDRITDHAYHFYHAPPHPNELNAAQAALRAGINDDWAASVQLYPEVLHYYYGLGSLSLPFPSLPPSPPDLQANLTAARS